MSIGPRAIFIHAYIDPEKQWLTMHYKLNNEELDDIVEEWPEQWKVPDSEDKLSESKEGKLVDVPIKEQEETKELEDE